MQLCAVCAAIRIEQLPDPSGTGFRHLSARSLLDSAQTCPLCSLIKASFHKVDAFIQPHDLVERKLNDYGNLLVRLYAVRKDGSRTPTGGANLISVGVSIIEKQFRGRFDVYAPLKSLAKIAGDVHRTVPSRTIGGSEVTELLKTWLQECVSMHLACQTTLTGDEFDENQFDLPFRLIDVGSDRKEPRLIQTSAILDSHRVRYVSLSHCWGTKDRRPLQTTEATLLRHLRGMPLQDMPQTFKEAIWICWNLGIPYLWIDSLCIIQDNEEDWRQQSASMGSIYEGSVFTIAASSAADSSQGLFIEDSTLDGVEIPYYDKSGTEAGLAFAYLKQDFQTILDESPLSQRAWVMQEYLLSRRILHFTRHGILWSCKNSKNIQQRCFKSEHGDEWVIAQDYPVWKWLVTSYSKRELTFKSDKLVAVQGLATEFGKRSNSTKNEYAFGLWLEDLPEDLFWYGESALNRNIGNNIPSWSWASTTGGIYFKYFDEPQRVCRMIWLDAKKPGQLQIITRIKQVNNIRGPMLCQAFSLENLRRMDLTGELHDEYQSNNLHVSPTYLLLEDTEKLGWCVFDEFERPPGQVWCLCLLKQRVWAWYASLEEYFYWVLVLQYSDSDKAYLRVGWGLILRTSWFEDMMEQRVDLL